MNKPVQEMSPAELIEEFIDRLRTPGGYGTKRCDDLQAEILRRMAW